MLAGSMILASIASALILFSLESVRQIQNITMSSDEVSAWCSKDFRWSITLNGTVRDNHCVVLGQWWGGPQAVGVGVNLGMCDSFHSTVCKTSDLNLVTFFSLPSLLKEKKIKQWSVHPCRLPNRSLSSAFIFVICCWKIGTYYLDPVSVFTNRGLYWFNKIVPL